MWLTEVHEVRVTMRGVRLSEGGAPTQVSTRSDFIAPDLSAPSTLALELDKGLRGWSDYDNEIATVDPVFPDRSKRDLEALTAGTPIRKAPVAAARVVSHTGPYRSR